MDMPFRRDLNSEFELTVRENGKDRATFRARGDVFRKGSQTAVATVFGEGKSLVAAEDHVFVQAQDWVLKRGRSR